MSELAAMFSIEAELSLLVTGLNRESVTYALCGALALAVYGYPRATLDIDLVALGGDLERIQRCARKLGFTLAAAPMRFAKGQVRIDRLSKVVPGCEDILMLDLLSLAPEIEAEIVVESVLWHGTAIPIVSRQSLARLKKLRGSTQDLADLEKLFP